MSVPPTAYLILGDSNFHYSDEGRFLWLFGRSTQSAVDYLRPLLSESGTVVALGWHNLQAHFYDNMALSAVLELLEAGGNKTHVVICVGQNDVLRFLNRGGPIPVGNSRMKKMQAAKLKGRLLSAVNNLERHLSKLRRLVTVQVCLPFDAPDASTLDENYLFMVEVLREVWMEKTRANKWGTITFQPDAKWWLPDKMHLSRSGRVAFAATVAAAVRASP